MSILTSIVSQLRVPDDQGNDWYAWASNQCSHSLLGVLIGLCFPAAALVVVLAVSVAKELADIYRMPTLRTARDSAQDMIFWLLGAWAAIAGETIGIVIFALATALLCGVIPRIRHLEKQR